MTKSTSIGHMVWWYHICFARGRPWVHIPVCPCMCACMIRNDSSPAYDVVCIHAYMPRDRAHELVWPNGYGAALLRRAPRSLRGDCGFESRLTYLLRMASILTDILMLTSLHFLHACKESPTAAGTKQAHRHRGRISLAAGTTDKQ